MHQVPRLTTIMIFTLLAAACASNQNGSERTPDELEVYGGRIAEVVQRIEEGADDEAELLSLLADLGVALAARGQVEAAEDALDIVSSRFARVSPEAEAVRLAITLTDGYARLELNDNASFYLQEGLRRAGALEDDSLEAALLVELVLTAARGEGVFADDIRAILDQIILLEDPTLRSDSLLSVADVLSRREVEVDVGNLLQQAIPATAQIQGSYLQAGRYATIASLFRQLGERAASGNAEQKSVTLVLQSQEPVTEVGELEALSTLLAYLRERGLLGDALRIAERIPLDSQRALEEARIAWEAFERGEEERSVEIMESALELTEGPEATSAEFLAARGMLARLLVRLGREERAREVARDLAGELRDAPANEAYRLAFVELLLYRIAAGEVGRLAEVVELSESADFRALLLVETARRGELAGEQRLQAGLLRQAAGEQPQGLSRETELRLVEELLERGLVNEARRVSEASPDPFVRAQGVITLLRLAPDYSGPI
ncbi:MAG: hypothetical protein ACLFP6_04755 [Spirochaetaceae bacterium]